MIIAVDFDGILCDNKFPDIGEPNYEMISLMRQLIDLGCEVVLWTSRVDNPLAEAVKWCEDRGLHFAAINDNAPSNIEKYKAQFPNGTRKVYADVYIDDHNLEYAMSSVGESAALVLIRRLIREIKRYKKEGQNDE